LVKSKALVLWFRAIFGFKLYKMNECFWEETNSIATGIMMESRAKVLLIPFEQFPNAVNGQEVWWHWTGVF